jgi:hypothetical protein
MNIQDENRKYLRYSCLIPGAVRFQHNGLSNAIVTDFSREGLRLVTRQFTSDSQPQVEVRLDLPWSQRSTVVTGEVKWTHFYEDNIEMGVCLTGIDNQTKSEILDYSYELWRYGIKRSQKILYRYFH